MRNGRLPAPRVPAPPDGVIGPSPGPDPEIAARRAAVRGALRASGRDAVSTPRAGAVDRDGAAAGRVVAAGRT
ncbi:hypothetical protein C8E95_2296 [Pseudonocardia autotrophica]|uniref:Uncharacterized protein n=1 Tax=Pseudonocardia autotrophica TaxID=2074 RepID=A0A1Y2MIA7_PSEAH|nr:hypothetical protein BG845_06389 [Pseudonocardia autotrophica]TDN73211.1 hypothetical protein C8E95_2296 [Pseudonocardia autotrophica]